MNKKLLLLQIFIISLSAIQAQTPRMVLAESFTSTTCGPCGSQNPAFDALLHSNEDKITSIKYHMSWPAPGNDPMYHHNTVDNNARRSYYSINSVPHVHMDGNYYNGIPNTINQARINAAAAVPSPFEIQLQHRISDDEDSVYVTMMIRATENVSGQLVAHIAVIEREIHFTSPPGTNGEKDFYNVMKALLPSRNGTSLPDFVAGGYVIIETAWLLQNVYNIDQIAAVAFVQDNTTKHVHQAANSSTDPLIPFYNNDAAITDVSNVTSSNCSGTVSPQFEITNYGANELTSASIEISINNTIAQEIEWSGSLGFLESAVIEADELMFDMEDENDLMIMIESANGESDDYMLNNANTVLINQSAFIYGDMLLFILLDNRPEETTWEFRNSMNEVVLSGGPYSSPGGIISQPVSFDNGDCYELLMYDAGGDGLCCGNGTGYYALIYNGNESIFTGQSFGSLDRNEFTYGFVGVDEAGKKQESISLYPNPTSNKAFVRLSNDLVGNSALIRLTEPSGRLVRELNIIRTQGVQSIEVDLDGVSRGLYLITVMLNSEVYTQKLFVR
ncbi:MAG: T9SS type A sorting domain-containing protein [Bacteroidales bacterium]|nr:T9SS type A sorting domain-containing protein [Bacteroidales bacterium]